MKLFQKLTALMGIMEAINSGKADRQMKQEGFDLRKSLIRHERGIAKRDLLEKSNQEAISINLMRKKTREKTGRAISYQAAGIKVRKMAQALAK